MSRFSFLPLAYASKYGISCLIDSRICYELIQRDFVIPSKKNAGNHEQIRTLEDIVENDDFKNLSITQIKVITLFTLL
jgi:hypothetical protein